jgi:HK97 family phage prohead protease
MKHYAFRNASLRAGDGGGKFQLFGYAARFDAPSDLIDGAFTEAIDDSAFDEVLSRKPPVPLLLNHDMNFVLAHTAAGDLRLRTDKRGLAIEADLSPNPINEYVYDLVKTRKIRQMSFSFTVGEGDDYWENGEGPPRRTIIRVRDLYDISAVLWPAYSQTEINARFLVLPADERARQEQEARQREKKKLLRLALLCPDRGREFVARARAI